MHNKRTLQKNYIWLLIIFVIWPILDLIVNIFNINFPIIRYAMFSVGTIYLVQLYFKMPKNTTTLPFLSRSVLLFLLLWLIVRFAFSFTDILNPANNHIAFKSMISGELILFFSFFLVNISIPLKYFRIFLKISFILVIIFLIFGIPMFGFFTSDILNRAELFVKYIYCGGIFLLLLFPYQKIKVNLVVLLGYIIAMLMMLIIARRNVVLYLGSALFFLCLVILFSRSKIFQKRKPILIAGSIIVGISALAFIITMQFNFDLFFERADTGLDSRESVITEFTDDFNLSPIDWYTGRGPLGTFYSIIGDEGTNARSLIENGYYQYILKSGFLFLIPFLFLSLVAIYKGFFQSKNHLSKVAAIIIIVNLIDMIGYGLPFLGLKYLNLLIAFGFCFSPVIRKMDDFEIRKIIRL